MQTILFTGGGSAGHVTPNIAVIQEFTKAGWNVVYAGSKKGIERTIIEQQLGIKYYAITTGKLRRYFSWRTFIEPFAIFLGICQAVKLCWTLKPDIIFSKGGFVAFPIVLGAWLNRIPVIVHESDFTPGLANKLSFPFANKIFVTFSDTQHNIPQKKMIVTGNPIRESLLQGKRQRGLALCQFSEDLPVLLILGGGLGSQKINETIRSILPKLLTHFQVAHVCGKGKLDANFPAHERYRQFDYLNEELADLFACTDIVISRAGANALYEFLSLKKPHILIPLSRRASRGDQIVNAKYFAAKGLSNVLFEEKLSGETLYELIMSVFNDKEEQERRLANFALPESNKIIYQELVQIASSPRRSMYKEKL